MTRAFANSTSCPQSNTSTQFVHCRHQWQVSLQVAPPKDGTQDTQQPHKQNYFFESLWLPAAAVAVPAPPSSSSSPLSASTLPSSAASPASSSKKTDLALSTLEKPLISQSCSAQCDLHSPDSHGSKLLHRRGRHGQVCVRSVLIVCAGWGQRHSART